MDKRGCAGNFVDIVENVENVDFVENVDNVASLTFPDTWIREVVQVQQHVLKPGRRNTRSPSDGGYRRGRTNKIAAWA